MKSKNFSEQNGQAKILHKKGTHVLNNFFNFPSRAINHDIGKLKNQVFCFLKGYYFAGKRRVEFTFFPMSQKSNRESKETKQIPANECQKRLKITNFNFGETTSKKVNRDW